MKKVFFFEIIFLFRLSLNDGDGGCHFAFRVLLFSPFHSLVPFVQTRKELQRYLSERGTNQSRATESASKAVSILEAMEPTATSTATETDARPPRQKMKVILVFFGSYSPH